MDLTKILMSQLGEGGLEAIAGKIGADKQQASTALEGAIPAILGGMSSNVQSRQGAEGLLGALDRDHDGSVLDNLSGFLNNSDQGPGDGILKHVLGDKRPTVEQGLSAKTGLNSSQIGNLLKIAAPLIMGYLGKQKRQSSGGFDIGSIAGLLGGMTKDSDAGTGLDLGDILNVVGGLTGGGSSQRGGLGGMLGKLFGK